MTINEIIKEAAIWSTKCEYELSCINICTLKDGRISYTISDKEGRFMVDFIIRQGKL